MMTHAGSANLDLRFWNKVWAITLLSGGIATLAAVEVDRATYLLPLVRQLDAYGLLVLILAAGTVSVHFQHDLVLGSAQRIPARRFALALTAVLAIASAAGGSLSLVLVCATVMAMHLVLSRVLQF
jgi:hypothetical protein